MRYRIAAALCLIFMPSPALADRFEFDRSHTKILFFVNHLGFADSIGEFTDYDGYFVFDEKAPEKSSVFVTIKPAGIRTSSSALDEKLQNEEFFNSAAFPEIKFASSGIKVTGTNTGEITGDVTLLGVTKPVTLKVTFNKADFHPYSKEYVAGFGAETSFNRSDFGMSAYTPAVGDEVRLLIQTEGVRRAP